MMGLSHSDRARLGKLLAMLGSEHAGERDAAGLAAHRLLERCGLSWSDVLTPPATEKRLPELGIWRATCQTLLQHRGQLRAWEISFLTDLPNFQRLSTKQRYVLKEIRDRILGGGQ